MQEKKGVFSRLGEWATKVESWLALGAFIMSSSFFSWVASQWNALAEQGWPAILLVGAGVASLVICALSLLVWILGRFFGSSAGETKSETSEKGGNVALPVEVAEPLDKAAYNQIVAFCVDVLLPACDAQLKLQESLIRDLSKGGYVAMYAQRGAKDHYKSFGFWEPYEALSRGLSSRTGAVPRFAEIIAHVGRLERTYDSFRAQSHLISNEGRVDYRRDPKFAAAWDDWRVKHNALVAEYEKIKRDSRFGSLFRPGQKSEWGGLVGAAS